MRLTLVLFGAGGATLAGIAAAAAMPDPLSIGKAPAGEITLVAGGCGPGFHPGFYGRCRPNFYRGGYYSSHYRYGRQRYFYRNF